MILKKYVLHYEKFNEDLEEALENAAQCETITRFHRKQAGTRDNNEHIFLHQQAWQPII